MRSTYVLLSIVLLFANVFYCSVWKLQVSAAGTGIGIREDGPSKAQVGHTISYSITIINLGDYWDRNITVTDRFPNGTSSSWNIPDLAPLMQPGHQYTILDILYAIKPGDVPPQKPLNVVNNAKAAGYADVNGSCLLVQAETNFPTFIVIPPVAIFTVSESSPLTNETVTFNASSSYDPDGQIVKFEWDWEGDGTYDYDAGINPIATHAYTNIGIFYPTLRVTDNDGLTNATTERIFVSENNILVGGYSVSFDLENRQTPDIAYVTLALTIMAAFGYLHLKSKQASISLNAHARLNCSGLKLAFHFTLS